MATGELTDLEVFGQPRELSDAEVFSASRPSLMNPNIYAQGRNMEAARETGRSAADALSARDPGIDYKTGIPNAMFRAGFSRMTNEAEKSNFLNLRVGQGKWGRDSRGAYFIKPEGLEKFGVKSKIPVSIDEQTATRYDIADVAGDIPAIAGGAGFGMMASGAGFVPGMAMAGLGAAGGKAIDEIIKYGQGLQSKSAGDVAKTLAGEGAMAAAGEGGGRMVMGVGRKILGPGASRMTPEKAALAKSAQDQGFAVRPGSVTDAPILARWERMITMIFGDLNEAQNKQAAEAGMAALRGGKIPASMEMAGEAVQKSIRGSRVNFGETMAKRYQQVDALVGDAPIVPTGPLKKMAAQLLEGFPKTEKGTVVGGKDKFLRDLMEMGDNMTVTQAQRLRTMLREASESPDLVPDIAMHEARVLKKSVEEAFDLAKQNPDPSVHKAILTLRATDEAYKQGIRQFDRPVIRAIAKDASRGTVDPDMVVDYLIRPDRVIRLRQVKTLVPTSEWSKVQSAHAEELLSNIVQKTDDPLKSIFNGRAFRDGLDKYGREVLTEVHGKQWVDAAYGYANALMLADKQMGMAGGIVAANVALNPVQHLPLLVWLRGLAKLMQTPTAFKYLTEGFRLGPKTGAGAEAIGRVFAQAAANARDETGSAKVTLTEPQ